MLHVRVWLALTLILSVRLYAANAAPLSATVTNTAIEVRNVTPGGEVALMTASIEGVGGLLRQVTGATVVQDNDGDGIVRFSSPRPIPFRSIWVAVDLESGRHVIAGPDGYTVTVLPFSATLLKKDTDGVLGLFNGEMVSAEMLVVRPKSGAWHLLTVEGAGSDGDKTHGKLGLLNTDAMPVGDSGPPPKHLKNGDILAVIDPGRMEVFVTEIGK